MPPAQGYLDRPCALSPPPQLSQSPNTSHLLLQEVVTFRRHALAFCPPTPWALTRHRNGAEKQGAAAAPPAAPLNPARSSCQPLKLAPCSALAQEKAVPAEGPVALVPWEPWTVPRCCASAPGSWPSPGAGAEGAALSPKKEQLRGTVGDDIDRGGSGGAEVSWRSLETSGGECWMDLYFLILAALVWGLRRMLNNCYCSAFSTLKGNLCQYA